MGLDPAKYYVKEAGLHHLNGVQAVAYARIRHAANIEGTNDDFGRTDRQRYVMEQLFNKAVTLNTSQYISLAKSLIPCSETSLSYSQIMSLAVNILLASPTFEQSRVPLDEYRMPSKSISGVGSCLYYDLDYAGKVIKAFIYDDIAPEDYIKTNGVEKNDWYANRNSSSGSSSGNITSSRVTSGSSSSSNISSTTGESNTTEENSSSTGGESSNNTSPSNPTDSSETEPTDSSLSSSSSSSNEDSSGESKPSESANESNASSDETE